MKTLYRFRYRLIIFCSLIVFSVLLTQHLNSHRLTASQALKFTLFTDWISSGQRKPMQYLDIGFTDQEGRHGSIQDLADRPLLITFFYTRYQNNYKCSAAVSRLAALQYTLMDAGMADRVRLLAITYEPQFDTPQQIKRYATNRGMQFNANAVAMQLQSDAHHQFLDELQIPVNYNAGWVNTHGVELNLIDAKGRFVRKYHTILWDNDQVLEDVKSLLAEK